MNSMPHQEKSVFRFRSIPIHQPSVLSPNAFIARSSSRGLSQAGALIALAAVMLCTTHPAIAQSVAETPQVSDSNSLAGQQLAQLSPSTRSVSSDGSGLLPSLSMLDGVRDQSVEGTVSYGRFTDDTLDDSLQLSLRYSAQFEKGVLELETSHLDRYGINGGYAGASWTWPWSSKVYSR
jgi:hypothetical protein